MQQFTVADAIASDPDAYRALVLIGEVAIDLGSLLLIGEDSGCETEVDVARVEVKPYGDLDEEDAIYYCGYVDQLQDDLQEACPGIGNSDPVTVIWISTFPPEEPDTFEGETGIYVHDMEDA